MKLLKPVPYVALLLTLTLASTALCDSPFPKRFGHTFEELRNEANVKFSNDPKYDRENLVVETKLVFNDKGTCEETVREIWVSRLKDTGDQGTVQRIYSPWYQNQPIYSAKIFDRNGRSYEVQDEDIIVSSIQSNDRTVLSDDMLLQAVLPGLQEGGIVEELTITTERTPFFKSGTIRSVLLDTIVPTRYVSVEIEAPENMPLKVGILGPEIPIVRATENGKQYWKIEINSPKLVDALKLERTVPANEHQLTSLVITTGQSWNRIATEYADIIDQKLLGTDFESILTEIDVDRSASQISQLERCKQWIQNNIRYTSIALGAASIIPAKPLQVLTKRFGDCKDQSSLLVGLLRELKIEAHVTLVNSSTYRAPYEAYPALNSFDHAIVMAICDGEEVWIDCTYPGSNSLAVPVYLQGKDALVAKSTSEGLSRIPVAPKEINRYLEERILSVADDRNSYSVATTSKHSGFFAAAARNESLSLDRDYRERNRTEQYRSVGGNPEYKIESEDDPWNDSEPQFTSVTKTNGIPFVIVNQSQRRVILSMLSLFDYLPEAYLMIGNGSDAKVERNYSAPMLVPFSYRRSTLIPAANGLKFLANEDRIEEKIGPVSIRKLVERKSNGDLLIEYELSSDAGELTVANLEQLAKITRELDAQTNRWMTVVTIDILDNIEPPTLTAKQIIELKKEWQQSQSDAALSDYIDGLINCGLVQQAISTLEEEERKTPERVLVLRLLGQCLILDSIGREFEFDFDLPRAEEVLRKTIAIDPQDRMANHLLSNCLARDLDGTLGTTSDRETECLELINQYQKHSELSDGMFQLATWLNIKKNRLPEAIDLFRQYNREIEKQIAQVAEWGLQENWNEISALRDRLADNPEDVKIVFDGAKQILFDLRQYKSGGKLFELEKPDDSEQKMIAKSVSNMRTIPTPNGNPSSPKEVVMEVVYRVLKNGINTKNWDSFALNPKDPDLSLETLSVLLSSHRAQIRLNGLNKERILDSLEPQTKVDGSEEIGFRCETTIRGINHVFFVVKEQHQYKLLLRGKQLRALVNRTRTLVDQGNHTGATKWLEWIMNEIPEGMVLYPESFSPAKAIWNSSRTKSPDFVDRVLKVLHADVSSENVIEEFKTWIANEKSNTKKTYYYRALIENLFESNPSRFAQETEEFLKDRSGYLGYKSNLIRFYIENDKPDLAKEKLDTWGQELPPSMAAQFEAHILARQGKRIEAIQSLKKSATVYGNEELWNSVLWTALFTDQSLDELWNESKDRFDPNNASGATLHTLACVKAQTGAISDAIDDLRVVIQLQGNVIKSADWLVIGMIAEQCGFLDSAKNAYQRVEIQKEFQSAYELAQLRLKSLP